MIAGISTVSGILWVRHTSTMTGGRRRWSGSWGHRYLYCVWGVRFVHTAATGREATVAVAGAAEAGGTMAVGSFTIALQFPMALSTTVARRLVSSILPPLLLPGSLVLQTQPLWSVAWYCKHCLPCFLVPLHLHVPIHPLSDVQMCESLWHLGFLGR